MITFSCFPFTYTRVIFSMKLHHTICLHVLFVKVVEDGLQNQEDLVPASKPFI